MFIQCTKKLLDQLGVKPEPYADEDPLFSWHAHLITLNRKKTVVLMNNQNRYVIVLYGLKAKDFKKFDQLIFEGIRETFREEGIADEIVEKFLSESGKVTFTKTMGRYFVAKLNRTCEEIPFYHEYLDENSILNTKLGVRASRSLVGDGKNSYYSPNEKMYKDLQDFAGEPIFKEKAVQLKVTLKLEKHSVWRRLIVPVNKTFDQLHDIFQTAFSWENCHLHEFYIYDNVEPSPEADRKEGLRPVINLVCDEEAFSYPQEIEMKLEKDIRLAEYIPGFKHLKYNYDFGDNWEHEIVVEDIINDYHDNSPECIAGEGNAPPEDVGGEYGFENFLEILSNPNHSEHKQMIEWGIMQGYEDFDMERVNRILRNR